MNLDLGNTIWLSVTRELLSFHKWFFTSLDDVPKEFMDELRHHSHTHPNKDYTTTTMSMGSHSNPVTRVINCGSTPITARHGHTVGAAAETGHAHFFTLGFAAAELGDPNWWEHTHDYVTVSCGAGGSPHVHSIYSPSFYAACGNCFPNGHAHVTTGVTVNSGGVSHSDHNAPALDTENALAGDTPESHRHFIAFYGVVYVTVSNDANHSHTTSGNPSNAVCFLGFNHGHTMLTGLGAASHEHSFESGYTDYGGESLAQPMGDGLTWVS